MNISDNNVSFIDYLFTMTDDVGIYQHSVYGIPDPRKGYTTDDNARALILAVLLYERFKEKKYLNLIYRYLGFLLYAQNENGRFKNFMGYNREFLEEEGSEDSFGRCLWALCRTNVSEPVPENLKNTCRFLIEKSLTCLPYLKFPRAKAYSIVGLSFLDESESRNNLIQSLSNELLDLYSKSRDDEWHWFENIMAYGNSFFPRALLKAYIVLKKDEFLEVGKESLGFLEKVTFKEKYFKPIGCNGWYKKGQKAAEYDEQPIEAAETMMMYLEYYDITKNKEQLDKAVLCYNWYIGQNSLGLSLTDPQTGACYDGLTEKGVNLNQGSESIVSLGIAYMEISKRVKLINDGFGQKQTCV